MDSWCWNSVLHTWNKTTDSSSIQWMAKIKLIQIKIIIIKGLPYSCPVLSLMWQVFCSLQSSEAVLQGHLRLWGKSLPPAGPCCWKLPFSCIFGPPAFCWWRLFWLWAGHPLQAVLGMSCLIPPQPLRCCAAFSPPPAAQPLAAGPVPGLTFCRQRSRLSLQPLPSASHWEHWSVPEWMVLLNGTALELFLVHHQTHLFKNKKSSVGNVEVEQLQSKFLFCHMCDNRWWRSREGNWKW